MDIVCERYNINLETIIEAQKIIARRGKPPETEKVPDKAIENVSVED
jgi:hypothetical protein